MKDIGGNRGASVAVRRGGAAWRIFDKHADGGHSGTVDQLVLVGDGGLCRRASSERVYSELSGLVWLGWWLLEDLLGVVDWLLHCDRVKW